MIPSLTLFGTLNAASQGLFTNRVALQIAGQNMANANTLGYSRQRPVIQTLLQYSGASVTDIQRLRNQFLDQQRTVAGSILGFASQRNQTLTQLESIFDENNTPGAMAMLDQFFNAVHDLSLNPSGAAEREALRGSAAALQAQINSTHQRLDSLRSSADGQVRNMVVQINQLTAQIANLNQRITHNQSAGMMCNELVDQRGELTNQLAQLIPIQTVNSGDGIYSIALPNGLNLVSGDQAATLTANGAADNNGMADIGLAYPNGPSVDITQWLTQGQLGGLIASRDGDIKTQINQLDMFAARLATAFNVQHRQGWTQGAVPSQNVDFFGQTPVYVHGKAANTGAAAVTASSVTDQSQLTFHDYEIRFGAGGAYQIYDLTAGTNTGPFAYTSGTPIVFNGMSVTISNGAGAPAAGDTFTVNSYTTAARALDLSAAVKANIDNIAASADGAAGDNRNALALAALQNLGIFANGAQTFSQYLGANQTALGIATQGSNQDVDSQSLAIEQINSYIDQTSGVSLDEESTLMIQYQRAFQANSRVITVVDELLQSVISMI
ncbi:MAG: flagellar hook-associated protein FlgK [Candidatus Sumerlaeota bacterium]|nr:flagellar hook-associated protein FlgK [Candidatus Sumerlaeota bacterium]